jgi:hypothetical protein
MSRLHRYLAGTAFAAMLIAPAAQAQERAPDPRDDAEIVVYGRAIEQIGSAVSASQGSVGYRDFVDRPLSRVGELAENAPGLVATQHSGTGKANQYFLRGFNLDHGTDLAGFVDGVPINLRTHGHGQGYLDLNFLIPELVARVDYRKGPYFADVGDFSAAGTVMFHSVDTLPAPEVKLTVGSFGYARLLAAGSIKAGDGNLLLALEATHNNGPWVLDENLEKLNGVARYSAGTASNGWSIALSGYRARWDATDQIPQRAVESGAIDRLGFVDPDLGGETDRYSLTGEFRAGPTRLNAYLIGYRFELTSNFTYFLEDPVEGDQFRQRDRRIVAGGSASHRIDAHLGAMPARVTLGADARWDRIDTVGLYRSRAGAITSPIREDSVDAYSMGAYANLALTLRPRLRINLGLRGDLYGYDVDAGLPINGDAGIDALLQPKLALAWQAGDRIELYANYGRGFHSNDVRGAAIRQDPVSGAPADRVPVLVPADGAEIGARYESPRVTASLALFYLELASELVFVGDGGSTEPNDATRRHGAEATLFWRPTDWLTFDAAASLTHARFRDAPSGQDHIPNSISEDVSLGMHALLGNGFSGSLRLRHFGAAPLIEDGSVRSEPTTLVNLGLFYRTGRLRIGADILNLFDSKDADITYYYASRLPGEPTGGVDDIHFHPVEPRAVRVSLGYSF